MRTIQLPLPVCVLAACLAAQAPSGVVVPAAAASAEANGNAFWACSPFESRCQLLLDESLLDALKGRAFVDISVRRNADLSDELTAGVLWIEISLSHSPRSSAAPSAEFAANRGPDDVVRFSRPVSLPALPPARTAPASWQQPDCVTFTLTKPFVYRGGTLCIETSTRWHGVTSNREKRLPWWTVDAVVGDCGGSATSLGTSCIADLPEQPAGAEPATLAPGSTATFWLRGPRKDGPAVLMLGTRDPDLDLTPYGARGCRLHTDAAIFVQRSLARLGPSPIGLATQAVQLGTDASLIGSSLFAQWLVLDPTVGSLGLGLSNGVKATLGRPTDSRSAWIEATTPDAERGLVLFGRQPVLRFGLTGE